MRALDEMLARHFVHRAQHRLVADAALAQRQHELHAHHGFVAWTFSGHPPLLDHLAPPLASEV